MKIERTRNAQRNLIYGVILKIYQLIVPFVMRTIMIYQMGIEYAGLNNLFVSIFQVLNLAELGIGAALTCSMYKPIAENDNPKICALLKLYKKCFNYIGMFVFTVGILCVPFLKFLINGNVPDNLNLYILYFMYLCNTVLSYWLFSYKKSLIFAHQRNDINSKILIVSQTVQYFLQIFVLLKLKNYYLYLLSAIFGQILNNLLSAHIVNKIYPKYYPSGELDVVTLNDIKRKVQGLVTNKLGGVILRSADSIVISSFLGLTILAIYQNYYFILTAIIGIISIIFEGCIAGIGNSLVIEGMEKNYYDLRSMTFLTGWILCFCCCSFLVFYQPFITVWVGKQYLMNFSLVISLVVYFFIYEIDTLISTFKDAAGIWYTDRYRPLCTAIVNLILNIILVQKFGLYGILWGTVLSFVLLGLPWLIYNVFSTIFTKKYIKDYLLYLLKISLITLLCSFLSVTIANNINGISFISFVFRFFIVAIVPNIIFMCLYRNSKEYMRIRNMFLIFINKLNKKIM